ncbi:ABC transporter substrate-binding protein [Candidatus Odyssella acanthamoebae]|uniref:ABC transporter substrate-binding protein n=1 Tax=Candidatus Odyssella acanthamoebae TaxID=91604 RepID=UPI00068F3BA5|nr:ABC transporter substrate-binding protein [Candidatus Paracaedibacter acanthamoebae]
MFSNFIKTIVLLTFYSCPLLAKTIGIIQVIEHPALDATRLGLIDTFQKTQPDLKVTWRSAQGNMTTAIQVAQAFVGQKVDVIVALGTTPAQAAVKACQETNIPVIFASVTDPESAGLKGKATGISNFVDVDQQIKSIQHLLPSLKKLGIIYNPGEANSEKLLVLTRQACQHKGLTLECAVALKTADVLVAAKKLAGKVDAIFINNDNTALAAFPSIVGVADATRLPVFASDADLIKTGALAVLGPDQYQIGVQTAKMVQKIINEEADLQTLSIEYPDSVDLYINKEKVNFLGLTIESVLSNKDQS